jgi:hypothetical protein
MSLADKLIGRRSRIADHPKFPTHVLCELQQQQHLSVSMVVGLVMICFVMVLVLDDECMIALGLVSDVNLDKTMRIKDVTR